ncbi:hypothetical protein Tco_0026171 [Tanacetum coccineum]
MAYFISQDKYVAEILKKFDFASVKTCITTIEELETLICACSRVSSFDLEAYSDSDYAGANLDRKSHNRRVVYFLEGTISWQCKKRQLCYFSTTEANMLLDAIVVASLDAYEKKLIQVLKIHTDDNVADLLTKAFDVNRESLERDIDGTEELLLPDLFILWLTKVSTDSAKLIPLGKDSTAIKTLEKLSPRV